VGAGIFVTDPVLPMERTQTLSGALHILSAFAVMMIFPFMAICVSWNVSEYAVGATIRVWLLVLTASTWVCLLGFLAARVGHSEDLQRPQASAISSAFS
jgi:hypothetical protein